MASPSFFSFTFSSASERRAFTSLQVSIRISSIRLLFSDEFSSAVVVVVAVEVSAGGGDAAVAVEDWAGGGGSGDVTVAGFC